MKTVSRLALFGLTAIAAVVHADAKPYAVTQRFALGGEGGWDYPSVDPATHLLYLSRADHVAVVDTATGKEVGQIADTPGVHGIALAPELNRGYLSAGKGNSVKVFDLKTRAVLATVPAGDNPDAILYDAASQRVFAFNGHSHNATVIDARTNAVVATIALGGKPEFARADGRGMIYLNIEDTAELAAIDAKTATLKNRWKLPNCEEPSGLALDAAHRRSFSTCDNQILAVTDVDSGKSVASVPIGKGVDGGDFDPETGNVFSANGGDGTISVVHETDPDHYTVAQTVTTQRGARTIALDPSSHKLYLPTADFGPAPAATADHPHPKPSILPGTFVVLVVESK
jgi:YVTN family beta-propeller protein